MDVAHCTLSADSIVQGKTPRERWMIAQFDCAHSYVLLTVIEMNRFGEMVEMDKAEYASPEMARAHKQGQGGVEADASLDMWGMGLILFYLVTGVRFLSSLDVLVSGEYTVGDKTMEEYTRYLMQRLLNHDADERMSLFEFDVMMHDDDDDEWCRVSSVSSTLWNELVPTRNGETEQQHCKNHECHPCQ